MMMQKQSNHTNDVRQADLETLQSNHRVDAPTPILKLHVLPETQQVVQDVTEDLGVRSLHLMHDTLKGVRTYEGHAETWDSEEDGGLMWGEKRAHDDSWRCRWLQQSYPNPTVVDGFEDPVILSGRSYGVEATDGRTWREAWFWSLDDEDRVVKTTFKFVRAHKQSDKAEHWKEICVVRGDGAVETKRTGEEGGRHWELTEETDGKRFEETDDGQVRGYSSKITGGVNQCVAWFESEKEKWTDSHFTDEQGGKWGCKEGVNEEGENWAEKWFDRNGLKEVDRWVEGKTSRGEKFGVGEGEEYGEVWEKRENYSKSDKWWKSALDNNTWGESEEQATTLSSDGTVGNLRKEKWSKNDSLDEREGSTDRTVVTDGKIVERHSEGFRSNRRHCDHMQWGECWTRHRIPSEMAVMAPVLPARAPVTAAPVIRESGAAALETEDGLAVVSTTNEKWWLEEDGNTWGNKHERNNLGMVSSEEKWYRNPTGEFQSKRSVTYADNTVEGVTHGHRDLDQVEWSENWRQINDTTTTEKKWAKRDDDGETQWGENSHTEGPSSTHHHWHFSNAAGVERRFWQTIQRNTVQETVTKTQEVTRQGEVVDWFDEKSGQCYRTREQWANKHGCNQDGDVWAERWANSRIGHEAEKSGRNARGDEWEERWQEEAGLGEQRLSASKKGHNAQGDHWQESWAETTTATGTVKHTKKTGQTPTEAWTEEWHDAGAHHWTRKEGSRDVQRWVAEWGHDEAGSWGKKETTEGDRSWGEAWSNDRYIRW
ncbi:MAG: hypothetical protein KVP17_003903 [Porospora cf. gigantea B]|uniref:uncharacterized protein n=1 Tax=Porospora cf. gigantea B TaxID=2853592 RepID=UPI003571F307|nr:MAG: hypothetical protein KVP17_003903 [Porospora cf. gigantea B]